MMKRLSVLIIASSITGAALADAPVFYGQQGSGAVPQDQTVSLPSPELLSKMKPTPMGQAGNHQQAVPDQQFVSAEPQGSQFGQVDKIAALEQQVRSLRGMVEIQGHEIKQLQASQRSLYSDLDQRMQSAVGGSQASQAPMDVSSQTLAANQSQADDGPSTTGKNSKDMAKEQQAYQKAYDLLRTKQYTNAQPALEDYIKQYPQGMYAVNAHYWLGELNLISGNSEQAKMEFNTVIKDYPSSKQVSDSMLKLGYILYDQQNWDLARKELDQVVSQFPNTSSALLAKQRLQLIEQQGH
ncbi:MAG: tol-pal system protein YbgF [Legionellales bacterium]|nr:tol-pal system protein YbgF [Legionellales bacterium]|tara:strand:+ start:2351 stop:3241 length:891 start_codon:yes stop_codon:yes gene_type:complete